MNKNKGKGKDARRESMATPKPAENGQAPVQPEKKIPVFFIDEAHKLYVHTPNRVNVEMLILVAGLHSFDRPRL